MGHFSLTDEQLARITPHLPTDTRGKERVDDRRVISGIVHVLKSGGRWMDAPRDLYRPKKTLTMPEQLVLGLGHTASHMLREAVLCLHHCTTTPSIWP